MASVFTSASQRTAIVLTALLGALFGGPGCGLVEQDGDGGPGSGGSASGGTGASTASGGVASGGGAVSGDHCAKATETACRDSVDCTPYLGHAIDEVAACHAPFAEYLGCYPATVACDTSIVIARDEAGHVYQFSSGCIPPTFEEVPSPVFDPCITGSAGAGGEDSPICSCIPR